MFSNEKFTDLLIDLHRHNLVFTVHLSPQGVVWRELNSQIVDHLQQFSIPIQSAPTSVQSNHQRPPDQQDYHVATWQLLRLRTHLCQTARRYEAAARLAVGNFTYNNLVKESGHKRMANPRDTSRVAHGYGTGTRGPTRTRTRETRTRTGTGTTPYP